MRRRGFCGQHGATLVELVMTIVIISVAIAGVVGAFSLIAGRGADPLNQTRAVALAQLYMDEILAQRFAEASPNGGGAVSSAGADCGSAGPEGAESRATFDDVDDYDNLQDSPPENGEAQQLTAYSGFEVAITVSCAGGDVGLGGSEAKRIDIIITDPSRQDYVFSAYRGNF
ncbi:MSHA pilin protein MshD [Marinobacter sp. es.048]|uniref:type IV pilus modification PilV family protein n=1 Tax=Marinobacter sp. es.048 TaxID=1761795 RepID=UPI000B623CBC|nr:type II secretion system protein [Marinobacter sp. es.048]SNC76722.1 MSHA pilin protein MshD [Marinobacter sp. es.048]